MYARTITAALVPGKGDEAIRIFRDEIVPIIRDQPGYVGAALYLDRQQNKARTVSYWESKEHEAATAEGTDYLSKVVNMLKGCLANKEYNHWEVGYWDRP